MAQVSPAFVCARAHRRLPASPMHSHYAAVGEPITHEEGTMTDRKLSFIVGSFAVAIGIFVARMLISPQ